MSRLCFGPPSLIRGISQLPHALGSRQRASLGHTPARSPLVELRPPVKAPAGGSFSRSSSEGSASSSCFVVRVAYPSQSLVAKSLPPITDATVKPTTAPACTRGRRKGFVTGLAWTGSFPVLAFARFVLALSLGLSRAAVLVGCVLPAQSHQSHKAPNGIPASSTRVT